jgi:ABC-2 type transport system ATP-binding protein
MEAILTQGLKKGYGKVQALQGLDLCVQPGSVFGFLGPNGAGKTTTIRILTGLAEATSGKAYINGLDIAKNRDEISRLTGYLPEDPLFYPWMTPVEFLEFTGRIYGFSPPELKRRISELLDLTGLTGAAKRRTGGFSRGMRQRLGMAQALINHPQILLLDEPASALDPAGRREMLELIKEMGSKTTVLMSTHILADVERVCDRIGIIAEGKLIAEASRVELMESYVVPAFDLDVDPQSKETLQTWAESLKQRPWVVEASVEGTYAHIVVNDVAAARRELVASTVEAGLILSRYEVARPSLEDIFLHLTGDGGSPQKAKLNGEVRS